MDINLDKYTTVKKTRPPNSPESEQRDLIQKLINKPFNIVCGMTKHMSVEQMHWLYKECKGSPRLWWHIYRQKYKIHNMSKIMIEKLEKFPELRERSKRDVYLAKWTLRDIEVDEKTEDGRWKKVSLLDKQKAGQMLTMAEFGKFGIRFASLDRDWRDTLSKEENKHLRGSDYDDKIVLEEKKLRELGYVN